MHRLTKVVELLLAQFFFVFLPFIQFEAEQKEKEKPILSTIRNWSGVKKPCALKCGKPDRKLQIANVERSIFFRINGFINDFQWVDCSPFVSDEF